MIYTEELLLARTGKGPKWWLDFIGERIPHHSRLMEGSAHQTTESDGWLMDLSKEVWGRVRPNIDLKKEDENIVCSTVMSLILTLWSVRIRRAKSQDPRRPVEIRQRMHQKNIDYCKALTECMVDDSKDHEFFPEQEWDNPFLPGAKDGDYV